MLRIRLDILLHVIQCSHQTVAGLFCATFVAYLETENNMVSVSLLNVVPAALSARGGNNSSRQTVSFPDESRAVVEAISPEKPINLISIWGPARTGKSFFMNALAGENKINVFAVRGGIEPCTVGAFLSTTALSLPEFAQEQCIPGEADDSRGASRAPMIGFVDSEGQGDKHLSYDMLLATPLLLISKVSKNLYNVT